jgi:hypothetical protein
MRCVRSQTETVRLRWCCGAWSHASQGNCAPLTPHRRDKQTFSTQATAPLETARTRGFWGRCVAPVRKITRWIVLCVLLLFPTRWLVACGPQGACSSRLDCLGDQQCIEGRCADAEPAQGEFREERFPEEPPSETAQDASPESSVESTPEIVSESLSEPTPEPSPEAKPETSRCATDADCLEDRACERSTGLCKARLCAPCDNNSQCLAGSVCLSNSNNERFCGADCSGGRACPTNFQCFSINTQGGQTIHQCAPTSASCQAAQPGVGLACKADGSAICAHHYPVCVTPSPSDEGYCSRRCQTDDCPLGFKRCADATDGKKVCLRGCSLDRDCPSAQPRCIEKDGQKQCQLEPYSGPEACGRGKGNRLGVGLSCPNGVNDCSSPTARCLGAGVAPLQAFCSIPCQEDAACGEGAVCRHVMNNGQRIQTCLPLDCLCLQSHDLQGKTDLFAEALSKIGRDRCSLIFKKQELDSIPAEVANDPFRLRFFNPLHREPLRLVEFAKTAVRSLDQATTAAGLLAIPQAIAQSATWLDHPIQPKIPTYPIDPTSPLLESIATLMREHGQTPDKTAIQQAVQSVPLALQQKVAPILLALSAAAKARDQALPSDILAQKAAYFSRAASLVIAGPANYQLAQNGQPARDYWFLARDFGYQTLYQAAWELTSVIAQSALQSDPSYQGFAVNLQTPIGRIILNDNADHTYDPVDPKYQGDIAFLLDTGGNDTYRIQAGANQSAQNPVSVLIDLAGADTYSYPIQSHRHDRSGRFASDDGGRYHAPGYCESDNDCGPLSGPCVQAACQRLCVKDADCAAGDTCALGQASRGYCKQLNQVVGPISLSDRARQGSGRLGIGILIDLGTDKDRYESLRMSQGFAALGVGILYDAGGDDLYQCEAGCQGSAMFGIGLLLDRGGSDTYRTYTFSQGYGYARGAGILIDQQGDDRYLANHGDRSKPFDLQPAGDPVYLSAQLPGRANSSFVQGAGMGRRADTTDRMFMSGGIGILRDLSGNDEYVAGVFAQATGFWYGTGILADQQGNDLYDGLWYVQSATAHFALSVFLEGDGNDKYNTRLTPVATHTGVGHDFSTAWLIEQGGDDTYNAAGLVLGSGNDNGYGFLIDNAGQDTYTCPNNNSLGNANSPNPDNSPRNLNGVRTLGLFLDAGGNDTYKRPDMTLLGNNQSWLQGRSPAGSPRRNLEHGVGLDGEGSSTLP